jgi:NACalpha-BTF3-like transcription factor
MMCAFNNYVNTILADENSPMATILNGHTTFLMSKPENRDNIKEHRMKWFINNYTNFENTDKQEYYNYYMQNINDPYSGIYNPPPCFYNEMIRQQNKEDEERQKELDEYNNDDIKMHYDYLQARHNDIINMLKPKNIDDGEDLISEYTQEDSYIDELECQSSIDFYDDYDYDDNYESQTEYYEEDDYDY